MRRFPEIDRAEGMPLDTARRKLVAAQAPAIDALEGTLVEAP
jgi:predicted NUDIX family NTP pyrophosphohydrolase